MTTDSSATNQGSEAVKDTAGERCEHAWRNDNRGDSYCDKCGRYEDSLPKPGGATSDVDISPEKVERTASGLAAFASDYVKTAPHAIVIGYMTAAVSKLRALRTELTATQEKLAAAEAERNQWFQSAKETSDELLKVCKELTTVNADRLARDMALIHYLNDSFNWVREDETTPKTYAEILAAFNTQDNSNE